MSQKSSTPTARSSAVAAQPWAEQTIRDIRRATRVLSQ